MAGRCRHRCLHRALMGRRQVGNPGAGGTRPRYCEIAASLESRTDTGPGSPGRAPPRPAPRCPAPRRAAPGRDGTGRKTRGSSWRLRARRHRGDSGTGGIGRDEAPGVPGVAAVCPLRFPTVSPRSPPPPPPGRTGTSAGAAPARQPVASRDLGVRAGLAPSAPPGTPAGPGRAARGAAIAAAPTGRLRRFPLPPGGAVPVLSRACGYRPVSRGARGPGAGAAAPRPGGGLRPWGPRGILRDAAGHRGTPVGSVGCRGTLWDAAV